MTDLIDLLFQVRTTLVEGFEVPNSNKHIASKLYYAEAGDTILLESKAYVFAVGTYSLERDLKYKNEYCYLTDSRWITYNQDLSPDAYANEPFTFAKDCFYKICFKRADGLDVEHSDLKEIRRQLVIKGGLKKNIPTDATIKEYFIDEAKDTIKKCNALSGDNCFKLILVTDTHNVLNGTWQETETNIGYVSSRIKPDAIIHLGDLSDGIVSKKQTIALASEVIDGLKRTGLPVHLTLGNHDANYFFDNKEPISISDQAKIYLDKDKPYYYEDYNEVRLIFLSAFDNKRPIRYGFDEEQVEWLESLLRKTPATSKILVFSHDAPLAKLDYWSTEIFNGDRLVKMLESYNGINGNVLGFIHGHTHADNINEAYSFPIISIANNKCEDFTDYKPDGFVTQKRKFNHVSQDLWDVLVWNKNNNKVELIRFGAGEDRSIPITGE